MSDKPAFIPEKLFVTLKIENDGDILGFASPFGTDKAFKKRRETQLKWAYQRVYPHSKYSAQDWFNEYRSGEPAVVYQEADDTISFFTWGDDPNGELIEDISRYEWNWHRDKGNDVPMPEVRQKKLVPCDNSALAPKIITNEPISGFQFTESVRRTYWGGGNVVWRVSDPRGFQLEISSANLARIMDCSTIQNGVILDDCVWGRAGAQNVLLPVSSDVYQQAKVVTRATTTDKISLKDVNLGDVVSVVQLMPLYEKLEYLGKFSFILAQSINNHEQYNHKYGINLVSDVVERYIFRDIATNKYLFVTSPKIATIHTKIEVPLDKPAVAAELNRIIGLGIFDNFEYRPIIGCFIGSKLEIEYRYMPVDEAEFMGNLSAGENIKSYFCDQNGKTYMLLNWTNSRPAIVAATIDKSSNKILYAQKTMSMPINSYYYHRGYNRQIDIQDCRLLHETEQEFKDAKWCSLVLVINGQPVNAPLLKLNDTSILAK